MSSPIQVCQFMLSSAEGGAERFFEKLCLAMHEDPRFQISAIIGQNQRRAKLLESSMIPVKQVSKSFWGRLTLKSSILQNWSSQKPEFCLAWMSRSAAVLPTVNGVKKIARVGGYYKIKYFRQCDNIVVNAPHLATHLSNQGYPASQICLIPNFGDLHENPPLIWREKLKLAPDDKLVISLGRLVPLKGHAEAIQVIAKQGNKVHLVIGGVGPQEHELKELAARLGVAHRVHLLGWIENTQSLMQAADACLFLTRKEAFGNVITECWISNLPVIAGSSEGPRWLIQDGINGYLVDPRDVDSANMYLSNILHDPSLGQKLSHAGQIYYEQHLSKQAVLDRYYQFFSSLKHRS